MWLPLSPTKIRAALETAGGAGRLTAMGRRVRRGTLAPTTPLVSTKRVIFMNRFFFPDYSATSQILTDLAFHLAGQGIDVGVVASQLRYDDPHARLPEVESIGGVAIHRTSTSRFGRSALVGRGFDYLS